LSSQSPLFRNFDRSTCHMGPKILRVHMLVVLMDTQDLEPLADIFSRYRVGRSKGFFQCHELGLAGLPELEFVSDLP